MTTGIAAVDERTGGLQPGGTHLLVGTPGPAKMVAALHYVHAGVTNGEQCLFVTNVDVGELLEVARAWGLPLDEAWERGRLQVVGFRSDFELRAIRTIAPEEILEELERVTNGEPSRIAIDPGSLFLTGGAKTLLGAAFMAWARRQPATVLVTFSVDGDPPTLPSAADWLLTATRSRLLVARRPDGLYQMTVAKSLPGANERDETITLELKAGSGLIKPTSFPARRGADRGTLEHTKLLVVSLGGSHSAELEAWASRAFQADVVTEPFAAVTRIQANPTYGGVLVHAPRAKVREAIQACRGLRPLTRAAIVFATDDAIRSTDRVSVLEAGADDCLSGGIDFRELGLRIKQSMITGARPPGATGEFPVVRADEPTGGVVDRAKFAEQVTVRAADADRAFFCVLAVQRGRLDGAALEKTMTSLVRTDEHDLVSLGRSDCLVLLQGAREGQLGRFIPRLEEQLRQLAAGGAVPSYTLLGHPGDAARIRALTGAADGAAA